MEKKRGQINYLKLVNEVRERYFKGRQERWKVNTTL